MSTGPIGIELSLDLGGSYRVVRAVVREGLSEITHATLTLATHDALDASAAVGQEATLTITSGGLSARTFTLVAGSIEFSRLDRDAYRYEAHLFAKPWLLSHTKDNRKFRDTSTKDIVSRMLSEHGIAFAWQLAEPTKTRPYCVQYDESDLAFVMRLLAEDGVYFSFDEGGVMILADRSAAGPKVEGPMTLGGPTSHFELLDAEGALARAEVGIFAFRRGARVAPGRATVNDWNWKKPRVPLLSSMVAERDRELEVYEYPGGFREPDEGARLAKMRLEEHRVRAHLADGESNVATFAPACLFSFGSRGGERCAGDYLLVSVEHRAHDASSFAEGEAPDAAAYSNRFRAIPAELPYRPPRITPRPNITGCHTAMVRGPAGEEIHTDPFGRFRAQFHWDREAKGTDADSRWIRYLQESQTGMTLARVGWEVTTAYIDGDPDRPVGLARNINGAMPAAYAPIANPNTMTVKTPSSPATGGFNEIKLDDSKSAMMFYTRAERDYEARVKHDKAEEIGNDESREVGRDLSHMVGRNQDIAIGNDSKDKTAVDRSLSVGADRTKTVAGSETVKVDGEVTLTTVKNETEKVGSTRTTITGGPAKQAPSMSQLASFAKSPSLSGALDAALAGSIVRTASEKTSRTVGGAFIQGAVGAVSSTSKYAYAETVGGVKLTATASGGISEAVGGQLVTTVGGAIMRNAAEDIVVSADKTIVNVGGAATFTSPAQIYVTSKVIQVEGLADLAFKVQGASIDVAQGGVSMTGAVQVKAGESVVVFGGTNNISKE